MTPLLAQLVATDSTAMLIAIRIPFTIVVTLHFLFGVAGRGASVRLALAR
jgi:hypothetical protein